jgi:carbon-monoxide dehydrogenase medium subunit
MRYETPTTTKEAATLLYKEKGKAHVLAGGTDLLVKMKMDMIEPDLVVDIKHIPATQSITKSAVARWWATCVMHHPRQTAYQR